MQKNHLGKILCSMRRLKRFVKPLEERIIDLDSSFYSIRMWIIENSTINEYLDILALYGQHSKILGLDKAKARILKKTDLTASDIANKELNVNSYKRITPKDINDGIKLYLTNRMILVQQKSDINNCKTTIRKLKRNLKLIESPY